MSVAVRNADEADAAGLARIYNHYIAHTVVTFETEPVTAADMEQRVIETKQAGYPWLVAEAAGAVTGYAYAARWKRREAYRYAVESTVYVDPELTSQGIGTRLYSDLIVAVRNTGIHAVIGGISLPNDASVRLHENLGFRKIGQFAEVGFKFDRWVDVGYWELLL